MALSHPNPAGWVPNRITDTMQAKNDLVKVIKELNEVKYKEMYQEMFTLDPGFRQEYLLESPIFDPLKARVGLASLCTLFYALAGFDQEYFEILDYKTNKNPFEAERYVGHFRRVEISDLDVPGKRGWPVEKKSISIYVETPTHPTWNAFECLDKMLESSPQARSRQFLHLLSDFGWFNDDKRDIHIEAIISTSREHVFNNSSKGSWIKTDGEEIKRDGEDKAWDLECVTLSIGNWQFIQYAGSLHTDESGMANALGYKDQIAIKKYGTKGFEQIHLYLDPRGNNQPSYAIHRDMALEDLMGGNTWTEKELRLAEMMELRNEIFLDKPEQFPILDGIQHLTQERLSALALQYYPRRREEILNRFGEGTIQFPKMEK